MKRDTEAIWVIEELWGFMEGHLLGGIDLYLLLDVCGYDFAFVA
jgi:hypothetical protein